MSSYEKIGRSPGAYGPSSGDGRSRREKSKDIQAQLTESKQLVAQRRQMHLIRYYIILMLGLLVAGHLVLLFNLPELIRAAL